MRPHIFANPAPLAASRRQFIKIAGAGLALALAPLGSAAVRASGNGLAQTFLRIAPDGTVTVLAKHLDMGQGCWSGLATLVAEELDADWSMMRVEGAPARVPDYGNLAFDPGGTIQATGGSTAIANSWEQYRKAGATARAMLIAAAARSWGVPPGDIAVEQGRLSHPSGKSAGFGELAVAAAEEAVPAEVTLKSPNAFRLIGKSAPRLDAEAKSTGAEMFGIDQRLPGMKYAVVQRAPKFGARLKSFDATNALEVRGVVDVVEVPSGVAVVADNSWAAMRGRDALVLEWDESGAETRSTDAMLADYRSRLKGGETTSVVERGDVSAGFANAAHVVEGEFLFPLLAHAPMEPMTAVCRMENGVCDVWGGIQMHTLDHANVAKAAGLPPEKVHLHTLYAGGSFGRRANPTSDYLVEAVEITKATGSRYPVLLTWTREDDVTGGYYRPLAMHRVKAGIDSEGNVTAWEQVIATQSILRGTPFGAMMKDRADPSAVSGNAPEQYALPAADVRWAETASPVTVLWWRSVEHTHTAFSKEVVMDELAAAAGIDPLQLRLRYLGDNPRAAAVLKLAAEKAGWGEKLGPGRGRGIALQESFGSYVAEVADVTVDDSSVKVDRVVAAVDCGIAVNPRNIEAQIQSGIGYGLSAMLHGKITLTDGAVDQTNFDSYPVLRIDQMPEIVVHIVPSSEPPTGVGEPGTPPIAPAVANAIFAATGKPIRTLPLDDVDLAS